MPLTVTPTYARTASEPIQLDPDQSKAVVRIFDLYSQGNMTFRKLADVLDAEGHIYRPSQPRFGRTSLSYILKNRFYLGEIEWEGRVFPGKHIPLVDPETFKACHDILKGKNHRTRDANTQLAGGLFHCSICGATVTGERIRRKLKDGGVRTHIYYRCGTQFGKPGHPIVRWREADLEDAIERELAAVRMPTEEADEWLRRAIEEAFSDLDSTRRKRLARLAKRKGDLEGMQERLLNAYLAGAVDDETFHRKTADLKAERDMVEKGLESRGDTVRARGDMALRIYDWCHRLPEVWRGSNTAARRAILETVCLNRTLDDVSLCLEKRKPFDWLAEGPISEDGTPCRIQTCDLRLRRPTLYSLS